uniref:Cysteine sulfinic acid decarboxylase n=1 Tax=Timema douglasi TaxID=61478 RepID=A0A7R8V987_TIMDO|nr:unnamed protein product [Timema douglasi]
MAEGKLEVFLSKLTQLLKEGGAFNPHTDTPVVQFLPPDKLKEALPLELGPTPSSDEELLSLCQDVIKYSVKTSHHHFHNQLYSGTDPYGLAGAWLTEALNTNQHTFEVSPVFTLVEDVMLKHILRFVGYEDGDGIFSPGGSMSNMYGMVLARYRFMPKTKTKGISQLPPFAVFVSEESHYSIMKGAHWLGIGTDNVIRVSTDSAGRMIPDELSRSIDMIVAEGKIPFLVVATAGSTVLGAFDPLDQLADICEGLNIWLHVDVCVLGWISDVIKKVFAYLKRFEQFYTFCFRSDSVSWNPHKMLGAPLQCSAFLIKEKRVVAYLLCFFRKLRKKDICSGLLTPKESEKTTLLIVKLVQANHFEEDIILLKLGKSCKPHLQCLAPFLDAGLKIDSANHTCHTHVSVYTDYILFQGLLHQCNSASATYLFQQDKFYDISYDTGDKSIQCGRKVDAFKLWLMWKARGDIGLERLVDNTMECARYLRDQIVNRPGFRMVVPEVQCTNVCFWYIPPALRGEEESEEWWNKVHTVAPKIKERLVRSGTLMIGYQPLAHKNLKNFFRAVSACHPPPTTADMDHTLIEIERHGKDLFT